MAPPEVESSSSDAAATDTNKAVVVTNNKPAIDEVIIHPLVLLSAADHYHRVARGTRKRVVGVLLGSIYRGKVDATNSFAVPFEEDSRNPVRQQETSVVCLCRCAVSGSRLRSCLGSSLTLNKYSLIHATSRPCSIWTTTTWRTCWSCSRR
jgi:JAB1/Mov34/MPN/PAD-1 ubiquitin protease